MTRLLSFLQNHPHILELAYRLTLAGFRRVQPVLARVGYARVSRILAPVEKITKGAIFGCQMCGQCTLHATGMTCPMTCPKNLRNGPCGGVRANGHCEVIPEMPCIWAQAYERSQHMPLYGSEILLIQPPLDRRLAGTSAWINTITGRAEELGIVWDAEG